ncbi:hypothetical protein KJ966_19870 [bacterium]|nr:hypothetical protein [bacterium]
MKPIISSAIIISLFILVPLTGTALIYQKQDDNGYYYFICEGQKLPVRIKIIEKNVYKVLSHYHGFTIKAESEFKAAQQVCGEINEEVKKTE